MYGEKMNLNTNRHTRYSFLNQMMHKVNKNDYKFIIHIHIFLFLVYTYFINDIYL